MKIVLTVLAVVVAVAGGLLLFAWGGFATVAATEPHSALVEWYLVTARERAIHSAIEDLPVPPLDDPGKLRSGLAHYHQMCVDCHGAPGFEPGAVAQGLNPVPPELYHGEAERELTGDAAEEAREEAAEAFWVVKHGIRMTGMPAFGPTHSDDDIWAVVALVQRLPDLSADEYAEMLRNAGLDAQARGHHGGAGETHPGGADHDGMHDEGTHDGAGAQDAHAHPDAGSAAP